MGILLLFLFILTVTYLAYFSMPGARRSEAHSLGRMITVAYLCLSGGLVAWLLLAYIGFPSAAVRKQVRHIEFRGVAVTVPSLTADTSNVRVTSSVVDSESEVKRAFRWFALPAGAWIDLRPSGVDGKSVTSYIVEAHRCSDIVRLNRVCVNDVVGAWLKVGEKASFAVGMRLTTSLGKAVSPSGEELGKFEISAEPDQIEISARGQKAQIPLLDRASLRAALGRLDDPKVAEVLAKRDDYGENILDKVTLVRYRRRDGDSAVGLVFRDGPPQGVRYSSESDDRFVAITPSTTSINARSIVSNPTKIESIDGVFRLDVFGVGSRNSLVLPDSAFSTAGGHAQLRFVFDPPRAYPLPPSDALNTRDHTIQLASADLGQDGNGYLFDTGNLNEGFLATASIAPDGTSLTIGANASNSEAPVAANENQVLGSGSVAPIFALADPLRDVRSPWLLPAIGLLVGLLLCLSSVARLPFARQRQARKAPVNVAPAHTAFVLWVVSAAILAIRAILAFRASILPPFNMDALSAASFRGTWTKAALPALLVPPAIGLLTLAVVRAKQVAPQQAFTEQLGDWMSLRLRRISMRPWGFLSRSSYALALLLAVLMLLQKAIHFPLPDVVLLGVLLVVLGLVFDGVGEARDDEFAEKDLPQDTAQTKLGNMADRYPWARNILAKRRLWDKNPLLWTAAALLFFLDPGTFLFFIPLCLALCVGGMIGAFGQSPATADERRVATGRFAKVGLVAILGVVVFGMFAAAPIGSRLLTSPVAAKIVRGAAFPYRLAATDSKVAEDLLVDPETRHGSFKWHRMQETLHQRWEMLSYERANGVGYFGAPLSNVGMTYATTLSDAAFSVYLVAEHGVLAGAMVIGLLLLLALAIFRTAWLAAGSRNQRANARGLYAIGGVFGCAALYMALANLWIIPFTGQNVPFLSLNSWKDLILNVALLVSAVLLIAFPGSWSTQADPMARKDIRQNRWAWWAFPALLTTGWVLLCLRLSPADGNADSPFNLGTSNLQAIQQVVDDAGGQARQKDIPLSQTPAAKGAAPFVRSMLASYDSGEVTKTPVVATRGAGSNLTVDRKFFFLRSPFEVDPGVPWHGSELAGGKVERHRLLVGGSRTPILLESGRGSSELILGRPVKPIVAQSIDIKQVFDDPRSAKGVTLIADYGGIKLDGDRIVLRWKNFGKPGAILVNGKRPELKFNELEIRESDIVSLEYNSPEGVPLKLSIHCLGATENKLSGVVWRNGRYSRTFPQGADFPLAYTIGEIGDEYARAGKKKVGDLRLSVDMQLQRDLQTELRQWARERARLIDSGSSMPDGLPFTALSVMDSTTGQIRALAALPQVDPREDFAKVENRFSSEADAQTSSRSSWTLVNRTIGSTIKPLGFSALNSQLDSKTFDLTKLHVSEAAAVESYIGRDGEPRRAYRLLGDIHLKQGKGLGSKENPRSDVDMFTYLKDSRTWPAIVTSTIGLVADKSHPAEMKSELAKILTPSAGGPVAMGSERMAFTPGQALRRLFTRPTTLSSIELADTAYFRGIQDCYGPSVVPFNTNEVNRWDDGLEKRFLTPFDLSAISNQSVKNLGLPEVHWADTTNLTDLDGQLVRYMIGGGECRWNAVTMAANFARITTGKKVQPTLSTEAKPIKDSMPAPVDSFAWRKAHLLDPLMQITTIPSDDVKVIRSTVSSAGYRIAMKTGTIDDGMGKQAMESEMLMFTFGKYDETSGFVPGHCISGFFSIRSAKRAEGDVMIKGDLIKRMMPLLVHYLKRTEKPAK